MVMVESVVIAMVISMVTSTIRVTIAVVAAVMVPGMAPGMGMLTVLLESMLAVTFKAPVTDMLIPATLTSCITVTPTEYRHAYPGYTGDMHNRNPY